MDKGQMTWIKITDRMPDKDITVLAWCNGSVALACRYGDNLYNEETLSPINPQYWCEITSPKKINNMQWIKIDRDENGFATEECLRKIESCYEKEIPVAIAYVSYGTDYDVITPSSDIQGWLADIHNSAKYTHYLQLQKLEV